MPVGRFGLDWFRARYAAERGVVRGGIVVAAAICALLYVASALWFDIAYWLVGRFAADRIGRPVRIGISIAFAVIFIAAISVAGAKPAVSPAASPATVAIGTGTSAPHNDSATEPAPPTSSPAVVVTIAPSQTPADADDEAGPSSVPGASLTPGPTGVAFVPVTQAAPADRLPGEPDPILTPGALNPAVTQATIGSTICVSGWTATIRPPSDYTTALKVTQMAQYGYSDISKADYEEDHLISLELGGSPTDPRNLWPEPYTASLADGRSTGAHVKDGFETKLKNEVCSGAITLAEAQSEIGDHWVHAYYGIAFTIASPTAEPATPAPVPATTPTAPTGSSMAVRIVSLPGSISPGSNATLVAATSMGATCGATVTYASGAVSSAAGLQPRVLADSSGTVSWTWKVGTSTKPGTSTASVTCSLGGISASDSAGFQVA